MIRKAKHRRGAMVLEMALVLGVFVVLTFGMFDLGIGVFRYHILANAARQAARRAIVHGERASALGSWGPTAISVNADETGTPIVDGADDADKLPPRLVGCDLANTTIQIDWLDGNNAIDSRVRATITSPYRPFMLFLIPVTLRASSTMQITH